MKLTASETRRAFEDHRRWVASAGAEGTRFVLAGRGLGDRGALYDADLRGADLTGAALKGTSLGRTRLDGACLAEATLDGAFVGGSLRGADLRGASLRKVLFRHVPLVGADLRGADLRGASLFGCRLDGARLDGAKLDGGSLNAAVLDRVADDLRARLPGDAGGALAALRAGRLQLEGEGVADLWVALQAGEPGHPAVAQLVAWLEAWSAPPPKSKARRDPLREALSAHAAWVSSSGKAGARLVMPGFEAPQPCPSPLTLSAAGLRGARLAGARLVAARLDYADLREADLRGADLRDAVLVGADLRGADLSGAQIRAGFAGADLRGARLRGARVEGLDLRWAKTDGPEQLRAADLSPLRADLDALLDSATDAGPLFPESLLRALLTALGDGSFAGESFFGKGVKVEVGGLVGFALSRGGERAALLDLARPGRPCEALVACLSPGEPGHPVAAVLTEWLEARLAGERAPAVAASTIEPGALTAALAAHSRWLDSGGAAGERLVLRDLDLRGQALSGLNLISADLARCDLRGVDLRGADLREASLDGARLDGARLSDADLVVTGLTDASLRGADLQRARLSGPVLGLDLSEADLRGANLSGLELEEGSLAAADLREARLDPGLRERAAREGARLEDGRPPRAAPAQGS